MTVPGMRALLAVALLALGGCASQTSAPVDDRRPSRAPAPGAPAAHSVPAPGAAATEAAAPGFYIVKRGDTLYSIALEHGSDYRDIAQWNKLDDPSKIRVGQRLRVLSPEEKPAVQIGAARGAGQVESHALGGEAAAREGQGDGGTKTAPKALRLPYSEQNLALLSKGEAAPAPKPAAIARAEPKPEPAPVERDPEAIEFIWPAKGKLLSGFAEPNNKGVDIGGKSGDPVVAAASGRVMYTGTGIRGYGKLIVIKHDNGFNSVYAHNREILVKEGQSVARGQKIAELGDSDADSPRLHFEIRKSGKPVDPARYLPGERPS